MLFAIDVGFNQLTGTIPSLVGQLTAMQRLSIEGNELVGTIPSELGFLSRLNTLSLGQDLSQTPHKGLHGPIPRALAHVRMGTPSLVLGNPRLCKLPDFAPVWANNDYMFKSMADCEDCRTMASLKCGRNKQWTGPNKEEWVNPKFAKDYCCHNINKQGKGGVTEQRESQRDEL